MNVREILIADSDGTFRKQLADRFRATGYAVETTDSTEQVFNSVLEKQIPVVLIGSGCSKKIAMTNLIPMLKQCNKGVIIILVSDEESLPVIRSARQEGIFYHALKPAGLDDTEEILTAVNCAFSKSERTETMPPGRTVAEQASAPLEVESETEEAPVTWPAVQQVPASAASIPFAAAGMMTQAAEPPEPVQAGPAMESLHGEAKSIRARAAAILTALTAAIAGFAYCVFAAVREMNGGGDLAVWAFFGFCALIAVGQLLPAFIHAGAAGKVVAQRLRGNFAGEGEPQHAPVATDKNK